MVEHQFVSFDIVLYRELRNHEVLKSKRLEDILTTVQEVVWILLLLSKKIASHNIIIMKPQTIVLVPVGSMCRKIETFIFVMARMKKIGWNSNNVLIITNYYYCTEKMTNDSMILHRNCFLLSIGWHAKHKALNTEYGKEQDQEENNMGIYISNISSNKCVLVFHWSAIARRHNHVYAGWRSSFQWWKRVIFLSNEPKFVGVFVVIQMQFRILFHWMHQMYPFKKRWNEMDGEANLL